MGDLREDPVIFRITILLTLALLFVIALNFNKIERPRVAIIKDIPFHCLTLAKNTREDVMFKNKYKLQVFDEFMEKGINQCITLLTLKIR